METGTGSRAAVASLACLQSLCVQLCDDHTPKHLERDSKSLLLMEGTEACGSCTGPEVFELPARAGPRPRKSVTKSVSGPLCADVPQVALRHFRKLVLTALLLHPPLHHPPTCSGQWLSPGWRPRLQNSILTVWCPIRKWHQETTESGPMNTYPSGVLIVCTSQKVKQPIHHHTLRHQADAGGYCVPRGQTGRLGELQWGCKGAPSKPDAPLPSPSFPLPI